MFQIICLFLFYGGQIAEIIPFVVKVSVLPYLKKRVVAAQIRLMGKVGKYLPSFLRSKSLNTFCTSCPILIMNFFKNYYYFFSCKTTQRWLVEDLRNNLPSSTKNLSHFLLIFMAERFEGSTPCSKKLNAAISNLLPSERINIPLHQGILGTAN